jgi:hypothetical protein
VGEVNSEQLATLASIVKDLSEARSTLERLEQVLPESNARADIQCGIVDRLSPLIESLKALSSSSSAAKAKKNRR